MNLPQDILESIGQFLPVRTLRRCMHLNSVFLHLYLKARYKKVLVKWGKEGLRRVTSLRDVPLVHGYIHHLELWMIDKYIFTFETFAEEILAAIKKMPNLAAINLNIKRIPPTESLLEPTERFFDSLWRITGPTLTHLTLSGFKPYVEAYIPSPAVLPNLQKLTLSGRRWASESTNGVGTNLPLLLNELAPQLRTLEISDSFTLLAPHLPTFHALNELSLTLRFEGTGPDIATHFLSTHTTLHKSLQFHLTVEAVTAHDQMWSFLSELSSSSHCVQLRTLKFKYTSYEVCASAIRAVIPPYFNTLRTLEISGRSAGPSGAYELRELVSAISMFRELRTLSLDVPKVNWELLILLSRYLPNIESLRLDTADFGLDLDLEPQEETFLNAWKLVDLSIYQDWEALDYENMMQIALAVPSIESFWGKGDMEPPVSNVKTEYTEYRELERTWNTRWGTFTASVKYRPLRLQNRVRAWLRS